MRVGKSIVSKGKADVVVTSVTGRGRRRTGALSGQQVHRPSRGSGEPACAGVEAKSIR